MAALLTVLALADAAADICSSVTGGILNGVRISMVPVKIPPGRHVSTISIPEKVCPNQRIKGTNVRVCDKHSLEIKLTQINEISVRRGEGGNDSWVNINVYCDSPLAAPRVQHTDEAAELELTPQLAYAHVDQAQKPHSEKANLAYVQIEQTQKDSPASGLEHAPQVFYAHVRQVQNAPFEHASVAFTKVRQAQNTPPALGLEHTPQVVYVYLDQAQNAPLILASRDAPQVAYAHVEQEQKTPSEHAYVAYTQMRQAQKTSPALQLEGATQVAYAYVDHPQIVPQVLASEDASQVTYTHVEQAQNMAPPEHTNVAYARGQQYQTLPAPPPWYGPQEAYAYMLQPTELNVAYSVAEAAPKSSQAEGRDQ